MNRLRPSISSLFLVVVAFAATSAIAQTVEITEADYWAAVRTAFAASRKTYPRRETEKYEGFWNSKPYIRSEISEYLAADRYRLFKERIDGDSKSTEEMLGIGNQRYCRKQAGAWDTNNCYQQPPPALETAVEANYRVEKSNKGATYFRKIMYLFQESGKTEPSKFISEDVLALNADQTVRERTITNSSADTRTVRSRRTLKHEYGLKLEPIDAPIK